MAVIIPCRGFNYNYSPDGGGGGGFFKVEDLDSGASKDPILIMSVTVKDDDVVLPVITLENTRVLYTFGAGFGEVSVNGIILLGKAGAAGGAYSTIVNFFNSKRVSKSKAPVNVTGPGASWRIFLLGLTIQDADPQFNTQGFSFVGNIAQPK
jgi:hypothetical protein